MNIGRIAVAIAIVSGSGCASSRVEPPLTPAPVPAPEDAPWQEGIASWYGPGLDGRLTASGEVFDQDGLTAAHPRLPFGTRVRVVNMRNGREVIVRINDRGPFTGNRIIDLSRGAARVIDMINAGTVPVRLHIIESGGPSLDQPGTHPAGVAWDARRRNSIGAAASAEPDQNASSLQRCSPVRPCPARG